MALWQGSTLTWCPFVIGAATLVHTVVSVVACRGTAYFKAAYDRMLNELTGGSRYRRKRDFESYGADFSVRPRILCSYVGGRVRVVIADSRASSQQHDAAEVAVKGKLQDLHHLGICYQRLGRCGWLTMHCVQQCWLQCW